MKEENVSYGDNKKSKKKLWKALKKLLKWQTLREKKWVYKEEEKSRKILIGK